MVWIFAALFVLILVSLFSGLYFLVKDKGQSRNTLHALAIRVGLSAGLLALLWVAAHEGWIKPHTLSGKAPYAQSTQ